MRRTSAGQFKLIPDRPVCNASFSKGISNPLTETNSVSDAVFYFGSPNPHIDGFNDLVNHAFPREWIL